MTIEFSEHDEKIARRWCELRGVDPDEREAFNGFNHYEHQNERWKRVAVEIPDQLAWFRVLMENWQRLLGPTE